MKKIILRVMLLLSACFLLMGLAWAEDVCTGWDTETCKNQEVIDAYMKTCEATITACDGILDGTITACEESCGAAEAVCKAGCTATSTVCTSLCGAAEDTCKAGCTATSVTCSALCNVAEIALCKTGCGTVWTGCEAKCGVAKGACYTAIGGKCWPWDTECQAAEAAICDSKYSSCRAACDSTHNTCLEECDFGCDACILECETGCETDCDNCQLDCKNGCELECDNCRQLEYVECKKLECEALAPPCVTELQVGDRCRNRIVAPFQACAENLVCRPSIEALDSLSFEELATMMMTPEDRTAFIDSLSQTSLPKLNDWDCLNEDDNCRCSPPLLGINFSNARCLAMYNPLRHLGVWALHNGVNAGIDQILNILYGMGAPTEWEGLSFGTGGGGSAAVGAEGTVEGGVLYGPECYGCYYTVCGGVVTDAEAKGYLSRTTLGGGIENAAGPGLVLSAGGSIPGVEIGVGGGLVFSGDVFSQSEWDQLIDGWNPQNAFDMFFPTATVVTADFGVGVVPVGVGAAACYTIVNPTVCLTDDNDGDGCPDIDVPPDTNDPPVAFCRNVNVCTLPGTCEADVDINDGSLDPDGDPIDLVQVPPAPYSVGNQIVTLVVADSNGASDSCTGAVSVSDCESPDITCPSPITAECEENGQATVDPGDATATDICSTPGVTDYGPITFNLGTTTVSYTATDDAGNQASCDTTVTVQDTVPPAIACAPNQVEECTGDQQAIATYPPTASDICDPSPDVSCSPASSSIFPLGDTDITCSASDGSGNSTDCGLTVTVEDTMPPNITCPVEQTVECTGNEHAPVTFDATASDICWGGLGTSCDPESGSNFPVGETVVTCTAEDGSGNTASCNVTMTVADTTPPVITSVTASPNVLWPPNHKMKRIAVAIQATDVCDPSITCEVVDVASDEPDSGIDFGTGETDLPGDTEIVGPGTVKVRSERDPMGDGRVYTITVECRDDTGGNATQATTTVNIYHDQYDF